jgi:exodeoxyribonuclease VII large subunit
VKVEALQYGDRKVYTVSAFNRGVADWLSRLPTLWIEGEVTELKRQERWQTVFFTLKDPNDGSCLRVTMGRGRFDALKLGLENGRRVHVFGRPELFEAKGDFSLRALSIEHFGLGDHLAALERLKAKLADEGLFAPERKRRLPPFPRRVGLVTGNDAAAKRDALTAIQTRFPPARVLVTETYVQGPYAAGAMIDALSALCKAPDIDVIVLTRGGGSFEDLMPFSDERLVRAVAACPVPVVSAVGHEQDTPLCDLAADARASTPSLAARMVVPDADELVERLDRARAGLARGARRTVERDGERLERIRERLRRAPGLVVQRDRERLQRTHERLRRAPALILERRAARLEHAAGKLRALAPQATLERGYAIVRSGETILRSVGGLEAGTRVDVELAEGGFGARVEDVGE